MLKIHAQPNALEQRATRVEPLVALHERKSFAHHRAITQLVTEVRDDESVTRRIVAAKYAVTHKRERGVESFLRGQQRGVVLCVDEFGMRREKIAQSQCRREIQTRA